MVTSRKTAEYLRGLLKEDTAVARSEAHPSLPAESVQLLRVLAALVKPEKILEIGTNIGGSAIELLKAAPGARIYTIEADELKAAAAKENFIRFGLNDRAEIYIGRAEDILPYITGSYQLILLDGPKGQYGAFAELLIPLLAPGGVLVCDNVLFRGMVTGDRRVRPRKRTLVKKLDEFLVRLSSDPRLITSVLPIGDGMSISFKH